MHWMGLDSDLRPSDTLHRKSLKAAAAAEEEEEEDGETR